MHARSRSTRLVSDEPLPPYSYVTGRFPHPTRDPSGHSFGHAAAPCAPIDPARWSDSRPYLVGCDLFNHGYYWEAHEMWEGLWHACRREGVTADFLKALIKLAAGGVKLREGRPEGLRRHAARAAELLEQVRATIGTVDYLGLDVPWLLTVTRALLSNPPSVTPSDAPVEIVFDFELLPGTSQVARDGTT